MEQPEETEVMIHVEMNRTAELKEKAIKLADEGDVSGAASMMQEQHKDSSVLISSAAPIRIPTRTSGRNGQNQFFATKPCGKQL